MNSRILREREEKLSLVKLKTQKLELSEDTILDIEENVEFDIEVKEDIKLKINNIGEFFVKVTINLAESKNLNIVEFISNNEASYFREINQGKYSKCNVSQIILNGNFVKTNSNLEEKSEYEFSSAYLCSKSSLILINSSTHKRRESRSNLVICGAAKDNSNINNDGIVTIEPQGDNCSGHQSIKNILLDSTTKIQSEPILEIKNHNVKCSHGATLSKIENEVLSYINSRGIDSQKAQELIIEGFFHSTLENTNSEIEKIDEMIECLLK